MQSDFLESHSWIAAVDVLALNSEEFSRRQRFQFLHGPAVSGLQCRQVRLDTLTQSHTIMENIERKQSATEAAGQIAGLGFGAFRAACRGKHMSAAIIVLAGAILLLGGSFIAHGDTRLFVQSIGVIFGMVGLVGWLCSSTKS